MRPEDERATLRMELGEETTLAFSVLTRNGGRVWIPRSLTYYRRKYMSGGKLPVQMVEFTLPRWKVNQVKVLQEYET